MCQPFVPLCPTYMASYFGYKTFFYCLLNHAFDYTCIIFFPYNYLKCFIYFFPFFHFFHCVSFIWELLSAFQILLHLYFFSQCKYYYMKPYGHLQPIEIYLVHLIASI